MCGARLQEGNVLGASSVKLASCRDWQTCNSVLKPDTISPKPGKGQVVTVDFFSCAANEHPTFLVFLNPRCLSNEQDSRVLWPVRG